MYTSTPADLPDPPFQFFEGLVPRLFHTCLLPFGSRFLARTLFWDSHSHDGLGMYTTIPTSMGHSYIIISDYIFTCIKLIALLEGYDCRYAITKHSYHAGAFCFPLAVATVISPCGLFKNWQINIST